MLRALLMSVVLFVLVPSVHADAGIEPQDAWMVHMDASGGAVRFLPDTIVLVPGGNVQLMIFGNDHGSYSLTLDDGSREAEIDTSAAGMIHAAEFAAPTTPGAYPFHDKHHPDARGRLIVAPAPKTIGVRDGPEPTFSPARLDVSAGETFRFQNHASETVHALVAEGGSFAADAVEPGQRRTLVAPATPGEFPFACLYHKESGMRGVLVVAAAPVPDGSASAPVGAAALASPAEVYALGAAPLAFALCILALAWRGRR